MTQQKEARLVNEWLALHFPTALQWKRVRLGPLPDKELAKMYSVTQRWADAVYKIADHIHILEAKMKPELGAISQLEAYRELFPDTPEFTEFSGNPIHLVYLSTRSDTIVEKMCADRDIEYAIYAPKWIYEIPQRR